MVRSKVILFAAALLAGPCLFADEYAHIVDVPDYTWHAGCFGSASGNLMGFWDRNGFPNFYTGPTAGGVAPLDSYSENIGIRSMWASRAGFDGREDKPGHAEDYWEFLDGSFESTHADPYVTEGRAEHEADCIGDFIGSSQRKWADLNGECSGNIDGYAFNFWDREGRRLVNFAPPDLARDVQSGLRNWAKWRGTEAEVFSQLADFRAGVPAGVGFTFEDLKAEIDAGYPALLILQEEALSRTIGDVAGVNPVAHAMVAYGYIVAPDGRKLVRYRTSWGSGDQSSAEWGAGPFEAGLPLRGVVAFHPLPRITNILRKPEGLRIQWEGPSATLKNEMTGQTWAAHRYVVERADRLEAANFAPVTEPTTLREALVPGFGEGEAGFYRVKLLQ